ncbi:hypothetical protein JTB14_014946 [Gonioctena quinquepunctata]|nr:hypothetical protein JTB14_014946 [Gonioctena quinquepunctata]
MHQEQETTMKNKRDLRSAIASIKKEPEKIAGTKEIKDYVRCRTTKHECIRFQGPNVIEERRLKTNEEKKKNQRLNYAAHLMGRKPTDVIGRITELPRRRQIPRRV